jgi:2-polyprenyl-3-methyl-5-hydroxy-6-metoxy-1,4-benzoquinol methylase
LPNDFEVITIKTVLEHLTDPLHCIKYLTSILKKNGVLILDYVISEGKGLDTIESLNQRKEVIEFLNNNFLVLEGSLNYDKTINLAVLKKK